MGENEQDAASHNPTESRQETPVKLEDPPVNHEKDQVAASPRAIAAEADPTVWTAEMQEEASLDIPEAYFDSLSKHEQTSIEEKMRKRIAERDGQLVAAIAFKAIIMNELWSWMKEKQLFTAGRRVEQNPFE